ncbi:MAG: 30S ribosomal protein S20 [Clostridia bacterium]|nr:30S ribosomal protein S20 [Clostridia bacterium]
MQKKRVLVNAKKAEQNKAIRSAVRTEIKKLNVLIKENKYEEAKIALSKAFSVIDAACTKNILHANNASNKKAKLSKKVNAISTVAPAVEETAPVVEAPVVEEVAPVEAPAPKKAPAKKATTKKASTVEGEEPKKTTTRKPRAKKTEADA